MEKVSVLAITKNGINIGEKLKELFPNWDIFVPSKLSNENKSITWYSEPTSDKIIELFKNSNALICLFSLGAVIRLIAPYLKDKKTDPAVIVIDDKTNFVISVLSGHIGGANELTQEISEKLNALPVITTAADVNKTIAVDLVGITGTTSVPYTTQVGNITMGLYSPEYATGFGSGHTRTEGNFAPIIFGAGANSVLAAFITVEIQSAANGGNIIIRSAANAVEGNIQEWDSPDYQIDSMEVIGILDIAEHFDTSLASPISLSLQTYIRRDAGANTTPDTPNLYYRLLKGQYTTGPIPDSDVLWDSQVDGDYIPHEFFKSDVMVYNSANKVNSQIPFAVIAAAQSQDEGWETLDYRKFSKTVNGGDNTDPQTLLNKYTLTFSAQLAKAIRVDTSGTLRPNICEADTRFQLVRDLSATWKTKSYAIELDSIPLSNYKNVENKRDTGFSKPILANIPAPFGTASNLIVGDGSDDGKMLVVYQPYQPITSALRNNELQTNQMKIRILDMDDETPAVEITNSTINFTITD